MSLDRLRWRVRVATAVTAGVFGLLGLRLVQLAENDALAAAAFEKRLAPERVLPRRGRILDRDGDVLADVDDDGLRAYPGNARAGHLLGLLSAARLDDFETEGSWAEPGDLVGRSGLEARHEATLRGIPGTVWTVVDEHGLPVRGQGAWNERMAGIARDRWIPTRHGTDVQLTLDADIQLAVERALHGRTGAAVALDVHSGAVLAWASGPTWDPVALAAGAGPADWTELATSGARLDRVARGLYEPGAPFRLVTATSALDNGTPPDHARSCRVQANQKSTRRRRRRRPRTWLPPVEHDYHCSSGRHGRVSVSESLSAGCEAWFRGTGDELGPTLLAETATKLGLGSKTGWFDTEPAGLLPDPAWLSRHHERQWTSQDSQLAALGRGTVLTTPLQLAVTGATIANGGHRVTPWVTGEAPAPVATGLSADVLAEVRASLAASTAPTDAIPLTVSYAGVGGPLASLDGVRASTSSTYVAWAPADDPVVVVAVVVEDGPGAHGVAANAIAAWSADAGLLFPELEDPGVLQ